MWVLGGIGVGGWVWAQDLSHVCCERVSIACLLIHGWLQLMDLRYHARRNQFERFRAFLELISRFEFDFRRCRNYFFSTIRIFGGFKVQLHAMRLYMCMCCGLFAPTQFHFECC